MTIKLGDAERLILYRLMGGLDPRLNERRIWTREEACITARQIGNRYNVPADAATFEYDIHYPHDAWTVTVRAVWRGKRLHVPLTTHIQVTDAYDMEDRHGGPAGVEPLLVEWLHALIL